MAVATKSRFKRNELPPMFTLIYLALVLLCAISTIVILIDAFQNSLLKGLLCILCGFYYIFYALFEFKHRNKVLIVVGSLLSGGVAGCMKIVLR